MIQALYLTHAEVAIDAAIAVPDWALSELGRARIENFATRRLLPPKARIISSSERKARDTARILAAAIGAEVEIGADLGENDRSSTGFLPPAEFEKHVDEMFAQPSRSISGWESALGAQARIVGAVAQILVNHDPSRLAVFVGHGCVGSLLKCHVSGRPIARHEDQGFGAASAPGGGNCFGFSMKPAALGWDWVAIENWAGFEK